MKAVQFEQLRNEKLSASKLAWRQCLTMLLVTICIGCAQKENVISKGAAVEAAERLERRAFTAYASGDVQSAWKDLKIAQQVYTSLAMGSAWAQTTLSMARIDLDEGRWMAAEQKIEAVLQTPGLSNNLLLQAHGRGAALALQQQLLYIAQKHLLNAHRLCLQTCAQVSALQSMQAQLHKDRGENQLALAAATDAMTRAKSDSDRANALRLKAQSMLHLGNGAAAQLDAEKALAIDQQQGQSKRVIADLLLLSQIHVQQGNVSDALAYKNRAELAQKAQEELVR